MAANISGFGPRLQVALVAIVLIGGGCSGATGSSPTPGATTSTLGTPGPTETPSPTAVATVPADQLIAAGELNFCSDIPAPPFEQYDAQGTLVGFDVDMGNEIARRLGLKGLWVNSVFDTIIAALQTGKCDAIISGIFITPERQKVIDFIPYFTAGESLLVAKGNPSGIDPSNPTTLCGTTLASQIGDAEVADAKVWDGQCRQAGKAGITILTSTKLTDAIQQLQSGHAASVFYDSPTMAYYALQQPTLFEVAGGSNPGAGVLKPVLYGIGVMKEKPGLEAAMLAALKAEQSDGFFTGILAKWGQQGVAVPPLP
jgi:polar amino acid transport system substrate-binding protein